MILLAILLPPVSFFLRGKILSAVLCFILQITLIGWLPAALWAVLSLHNAREEKRTKRIVREMRRARG